MAAAVGAGWSALGAAIQGGMGGFAQRQQQILDKARADSQQKLLDESVAEAPLRRAQAIAQQALLEGQVANIPGQAKTAAANQALLQDRVDELPKEHAKGDVEALTKQLGDSRFNDPGFVKAMELSGTPLQTNTGPLPLSMAKNPDGSPIDVGKTTAQLGVAPNTGVTIPSEVLLKQKQDQRAGEQADLITQYLRKQAGADGPPAQGAPPPADPATTPPVDVEPPFEDPQAARDRVMGKLSGIDTGQGQHESAAHKAYLERQAARIKTEVPPALMQRVTGQMSAMTDNLTTAQKELEKLYPGIDKSVQIDPQTGVDSGTGQYNGPLDLVKAKGQRLLYNFKYTPYNKAIQAASLANVTGWGTIVPGRINAQIVDKLKEHQSAFGTETPLATYLRNKELIDMTARNRQDLLNAGRPNTQPVAPDVRPPIKVEGNPQFDAPKAPSAQLKSGDTIPMAEVTVRAQKLGMDPNKLAAGLLAGGVKVLK